MWHRRMQSLHRLEWDCMGQLSLIQLILGQVSGIPQILWAVPKWHHHHLAKRERLWDWDRSNALCTLYILLVILVYLSDVFISLDCFFTECSISLWIKEVWIILCTFFSFIVFQTMNFASYALSHLLCTLLVINLAIFATQNFAGIYFCNLNKKNMKKGIKFHDFHINFYITWNKQNGNLVPIR